MNNSAHAPALKAPYVSTSTIVLATLGLYLIAPAFTAVHPEGFSAQIQSIALAMGSFGIERHDSYQPALTEFIFYTRQGVSGLLHAIDRFFGVGGDAGFRILNIASLLIVLASSVRFARDRGRADMRLALACLLLTPGIVETAFFFNDNIVSAAFACLAMAVAGPRTSVLRYGASGTLFGMAILCRLDAVFALPFIAGLAFHDSPSIPHLARRAVAFSAGLLLLLGAFFLLTGASMFDAIRIAQEFSQLSKRWMASIYVMPAIYFFGILTPLHMIIGAIPDLRDLIRGQRFWYPLTLVAYPVLLTIYAMNTGHQIRYMFPLLAPVICLHAERGLRWMLDHRKANTGIAPRVRWVWIALLLYALMFPPTAVILRDGPQAMTGRLYMPIVAWRWQDATKQSMQRVDALVSQLVVSERPLVISAHYNDDFYLKLRLMEAGYVDTPVARRYPACGGFTIYTRGTHEILHIRLNNNWQLSSLDQDIVSALVLTRAFECPVIREQRMAIVSRFGAHFSALDWRRFGINEPSFAQPLAMPFAEDYGLALVLGSDCCTRSVGLFSWAELDRGQLDALLAGAHATAASAARTAKTSPEALYSELHARVQSRITPAGDRRVED
ncbi:hypothetical protein GCM10027034_12990 [Ramlibacter solisilvae]|uniref:Uncharacterized protein n=1 Tax=Ramlibacter tataouinensis TaxID=94132 RepID=A0A127JX06_9BURK|nr:hypothetical protein [Ramlibacter tataouinensis]AMO24435.1 hypothetical protein UC35_18330 [Ramlibacter tataouinensis]